MPVNLNVFIVVPVSRKHFIYSINLVLSLLKKNVNNIAISDETFVFSRRPNDNFKTNGSGTLLGMKKHI